MREVVRNTAGKVLRSDDLTAGEKQTAAGMILSADPAYGNPHIVRCGWCHESRMLFRDENEGPFTLTAHGWRCEPCDTAAASQEVKF